MPHERNVYACSEEGWHACLKQAYDVFKKVRDAKSKMPASQSLRCLSDASELRQNERRSRKPL